MLVHHLYTYSNIYKKLIYRDHCNVGDTIILQIIDLYRNHQKLNNKNYLIYHNQRNI